MKDVKTWLWEGAKTALRFLVIALVPVLLDAGLQLVQVLIAGVPKLTIGETGKWIILLALAGLDKAIHEWKKDTDSEGRWKGLIGF
jgi:hypothetical protein